MRVSHTISKDQHFVLTKFGILLEPTTEPFANRQRISIAEVLEFPFSVYFEDPEGRFKLANETNAAMCGFDSPVNAMNKEYFRVFEKTTAQGYRQNDLAALNSKTLQIVDEYANYEHGQAIILSLKWPWIDENAKVVGLFGLSIDTSEISSGQAISMIQAKGLLNAVLKFPAKPFFGTLTQRQLQCAKIFIRGRSAKEIANCLDISTRTVEHYIEDMKMKFDCRKKSELIDKLRDHLLD